MKLTVDQKRAILDGEKIEGFDYEWIEKTEWQVDHKSQTCEVIFKHNKKYYTFVVYREGSYYQGYDIEFFEDEAVEVTIETYISYRWIQVTAQENPPESIPCNPEDVPTLN